MFISLICTSCSVVQTVSLKLNYVQVAGEMKISGNGDSALVQQTAIVSLKVTNDDNVGCAGKTPTSVTLFRSETGADGEISSFVPVSEETEAAVRIATVPSHSTARAESVFTGQDGIVQVNVYFAFIKPNASAHSFYLRFDFDGGVASSAHIGPLTKAVVADHAKTANFVSSLTTIQAPPRKIEVKKPFVLGLQLRNPEGSTDELLRSANAEEGTNLMICQVMCTQ